MCTGSGVRRPSAETDCALVLSHSPRRASESMHGWAGVCDVSLPENPVVRRLVGSSWLRVAGERNLDLSRMLNCATPSGESASVRFGLAGSAAGSWGREEVVGVLALE